MREDDGFAVERIGSLLIVSFTILGVLLGYWGLKNNGVNLMDDYPYHQIILFPS